MTKGIKALNNRGEITLCTAKNPGTGNCNHVLHQFEGMSDSEFQSQVDGYNEKLAEAEDVYSKLELGLSKEQEEKLRSAGLCEAYLASGGSKELFKKACNNISRSGDEIFVADSEDELYKKLYNHYYSEIEDNIIRDIENGGTSEYGWVNEDYDDDRYDDDDDEDEDDDYDDDEPEYEMNFEVDDVRNILEDSDIVPNMNMHFEKVNGKFYAVNVD